jgi:hypothetical protein
VKCFGISTGKKLGISTRFPHLWDEGKPRPYKYNVLVLDDSNSDVLSVLMSVVADVAGCFVVCVFFCHSEKWSGLVLNFFVLSRQRVVWWW